MCVVIDANVIHCFFNPESDCHEIYEPVFNWIMNGKGKMIYGGKKYKKELRAAIGKYRRLLSLLEKSGKIVKLNDEDVDEKQREIELLETSSDFDDPHLIAIIINSRCKILCTNERRAIRFIQMPKFYPSSNMRPRIYSNKAHIRMTRDTRNLVPICK